MTDRSSEEATVGEGAYGSERRRQDRRGGAKDRRRFYPRLLRNRGKTSLPFTTREPDYKVK